MWRVLSSKPHDYGPSPRRLAESVLTHLESVWVLDARQFLRHDLTHLFEDFLLVFAQLLIFQLPLAAFCLQLLDALVQCEFVSGGGGHRHTEVLACGSLD